MISRMAMVAATAVALAAPVYGGTGDVMIPFYGNTWIYTAADGTKKLHINPDNTVEFLHHDGNVYKGRWTQTESTVCFYVGEDESCFTDLAGRKVGVLWNGKKPDKMYTGLIKAGRESLVNAEHNHQ